MDKNKARHLWGQLCSDTVGGNESEAYERVMPLGMVATSHGLPLYINGSTVKQDAIAVAEFLESWAKALREN